MFSHVYIRDNNQITKTKLTLNMNQRSHVSIVLLQQIIVLLLKIICHMVSNFSFN